MCTCITDVCHCCAGLGFESVVAICLTVLLGLLILHDAAIAIVLIVTIHKRCTASEKNQREKSENERLTAMTFANSSNKSYAQQSSEAARYNGMSIENKIIVCCDRCKKTTRTTSETKTEAKEQDGTKVDDPNNEKATPTPDNTPPQENE